MTSLTCTSRPLLLGLATVSAVATFSSSILAQSAAPAATAKDQTVQLTPFEVQADADNSYGALNSNSMTAFNVALDHLPISADIFDQTFMNDVGATSVEDMIGTYSAGAGSSPLGAGSPLSVNQPEGGNNTLMQFRGMMTPNTQRDSLMVLGVFGSPGGTAIGQTSNFDVERVELINGPQALLYDGGGGGGVINVVSKQARFGRPAFGSFSYRVDPYGTKYGQFDYGASAGHFAVRVAILNATQDTREINIGGHTDGQYVQFAGEFGNTVVRVSLEQTANDRRYRGRPTVTSTAADPLFKYNGDSLSYLLASGQAGAIDNGNLNWGNVNSYYGQWTSASTTAEFGEIEVDSKWTEWLSTRLSAGLSGFTNDQVMDQSFNFYTPQATSNPLPGHWTVTTNTGAADQIQPYHGKSARFSVLLTNDLFGGKAKSQSIIGIDTIGSRGGIHRYDLYQADANGNVIVNAATATNSSGGRTLIPKLAWSVDDGPVSYPYFRPGSPSYLYQGTLYVRQAQNPMSKAAVSQQNPIGDTIVGGGNGENTDLVNTGVYAVNYTSWMDGKLDTLAGVRLEHSYEYNVGPPSAFYNPDPFDAIESHNFNFEAGADYHVTPWLAPYVSVAMSWLPPPNVNFAPDGTSIPVSRAFSEEAGVKINVNDRLSGSLALYHSFTKNEEFQFSNTLVQDVNPTGLNGVYNSLSNTNTPVDVKSEGVQLSLTATPTDHWRIRFNAAIANGTIESNKIYPQFYNDQFHENSAGQVTYADGTVVYVPPTFNSKTLTVASTTPGAVPLTVTALSTPSNAYYASPAPGNGQIATGSPGGLVLKTVDPVHGAILTGATGLPISAYQLNPALSGVSLPGAIPFALAGQQTAGYPEFSANVTSVYTFASGWEKGIELGGTLAAATKYRDFYMYPNGLAAGGPTAQPVMYYLPPFGRIDLILGYTRKFRGFTFSTRLNVYNLLNHYDVIVQPTPSLGYTSPAALTGIYTQAPRTYAWTNTVSF